MAGLDENTKLLIHGDGNNGAKEIVDDGSTGHVVTENGAAKLLSGKSVHFDGTNQYVTFPSSSDFNLPNSGSVTVEFWIQLTDLAGTQILASRFLNGSNYFYMMHRNNGDANDGFYMEGKLADAIFLTGPNGNKLVGGELTDNDWHHVVWAFIGGVAGLYVDGDKVDYATINLNLTLTSVLSLGARTDQAVPLDGNIDDFRWQASNIYSLNPTTDGAGAYTVPTTHPTIDSNTKLLLHFDDDYVDATGNHGTGTAYNSPTFVDPVFPLSPLTGGRTVLDLDGAVGTYLSMANHADVQFGSGDFTIDFWFKWRDYVTSPTYVYTTFFSSYGGVGNRAYFMDWGYTTGEIRTNYVTSGPTYHAKSWTSGWTPDLDRWYHFAWVRNGTTGVVYRDGVALGSQDMGTDSIVDPNYDFYIGTRHLVTSHEANGFMDEFRVVKGEAVWTAGFTPPTEPYTADDTTGSTTKLLLHMDSHDWSGDGTPLTPAYHIPTFTATAQVSTAASKFGTASLLFDGNSDYIAIPDSPDWDVFASTTDSWTIDLWAKHSGLSANQTYLAQVESWNVSNWAFYLNSSNTLFFWLKLASTNYLLMTGGTINDSNWHHVAFVKVGTDCAVYLDGTRVSTGTSAAATFIGTLSIGATNVPGNYMNGYLDEIRIQNSNYFNLDPTTTGTFTPPTEAYSYGATQILTRSRAIIIA